MQKLSSLLFTTLISISIIALAHASMAQKSAAPCSRTPVSSRSAQRVVRRCEPAGRNRPIC